MSTRGSQERGLSMSALVSCVLVMVGLVTDGAQRLRAQRESAVVAQQAARAGGDAAAASRLNGETGQASALAAARSQLRLSGMRGSARLESGEVVVRVEHQSSTTLLGLIGIDHLSADAEARARLVPGR